MSNFAAKEALLYQCQATILKIYNTFQRPSEAQSGIVWIWNIDDHGLHYANQWNVGVRKVRKVREVREVPAGGGKSWISNISWSRLQRLWEDRPALICSCTYACSVVRFPVTAIRLHETFMWLIAWDWPMGAWDGCTIACMCTHTVLLARRDFNQSLAQVSLYFFSLWTNVQKMLS